MVLTTHTVLPPAAYMISIPFIAEQLRLKPSYSMAGLVLCDCEAATLLRSLLTELQLNSCSD